MFSLVSVIRDADKWTKLIKISQNKGVKATREQDIGKLTISYTKKKQGAYVKTFSTTSEEKDKSV